MTLLTIIRFQSGSIQVEHSPLQTLTDTDVQLADVVELFAHDPNVVEIRPFRIVQDGRIIREF